MKKILALWMVSLCLCLFVGCYGQLVIQPADTAAEVFTSATEKSSVCTEETEPQNLAEKPYTLPYEIIELYEGESLSTERLMFDSLKTENPAVAFFSFDEKKLMANKEGLTTITAEKDGQFAFCTVKVKALPAEPEEKQWKEAKYRLVVNKLKNYVVAYGWEDKNLTTPLRAMICSSGRASPSGTYTISYRREWNRLYGNVWGKYATSIYKDFLFHSVPYALRDSATILGEEYNKLGTVASMGCIRLRVVDSKWIYDYCKDGSQVIFTSENRPCPIPFEPAIELTEKQCWDPTDPDTGNPWHQKTPSLKGSDLTLDAGLTEEELQKALSGFTAQDSVGNDISDRIQIDILSDLTRPGYYRVLLQVKDDLQKTAEGLFTICVIPRDADSDV